VAFTYISGFNTLSGFSSCARTRTERVTGSTTASIERITPWKLFPAIEGTSTSILSPTCTNGNSYS